MKKEQKVPSAPDLRRPDGSVRLPDPVLPPSAAELEQKREEHASAVEVDPLPATLKESFEVQKRIICLPDKDPTKSARLRRIGLHIAALSAGPTPPTVYFQLNPSISDDFVNGVRAQLTAKKK